MSKRDKDNSAPAAWLLTNEGGIARDMRACLDRLNSGPTAAERLEEMAGEQRTVKLLSAFFAEWARREA